MTRAAWRPANNPVPKIQDASRRGVTLAAEHVLGESRRVVPHDTGTLERSGRVVSEGTGAQSRAGVTYDTTYAVIQHEATHYRHQKGRRAKYLEGPMNASRGVVREIIARALRGAL